MPSTGINGTMPEQEALELRRTTFWHHIGDVVLVSMVDDELARRHALADHLVLLEFDVRVAVGDHAQHGAGDFTQAPVLVHVSHHRHEAAYHLLARAACFVDKPANELRVRSAWETLIE